MTLFCGSRDLSRMGNRVRNGATQRTWSTWLWLLELFLPISVTLPKDSAAVPTCIQNVIAKEAIMPRWEDAQTGLNTKCTVLCGLTVDKCHNWNDSTPLGWHWSLVSFWCRWCSLSFLHAAIIRLCEHSSSGTRWNKHQDQSTESKDPKASEWLLIFSTGISAIHRFPGEKSQFADHGSH